MFYMPNMRDVTAQGVETVMRTFFAAHGVFENPEAKKDEAPSAEELVCEELLLEASAP